ncbi:MAG: hypothetical protein QOH54_2339 [Mycobacterium sp.]|jgi:hypothetical protein|nr:hypothetical protein [Mycobacterium sp.]
MTTTDSAKDSLSVDAAHAELTREQIGHLRHFTNLLNQPSNDWSLMQGKGLGQDDFGGYRFHLAYLTYALALTHKHRLPAAPGLFKPLFEKAIEKILLPEVWIYWKDTSRGGAIFNAHLADKYHEEYNPVVKDNIMYSAYVQSMALLYNYLFDDDRYAQPGALTFSFYTPFWGGPEKRFEYDQNTLNDHVYWLMVQSGYLGVPCEPNCIWQICNQPAILGFRMHDFISGGSVADEVTSGYERAWKQYGRLDQAGRYTMMIMEDSKTPLPNAGTWAWIDAWSGALLNMWNRDFVHTHYPEQIKTLLVPRSDGTIGINPGQNFVIGDHQVVGDGCDLGWVAAWAAEIGDQQTLDGLLAFADCHLKPKWRDGGLYYPRNDVEYDVDGVRTMMEPLVGNVLLGYARLNVADGMWKLYNQPWDRSHWDEPALTTVAANVDVTRAYFDREAKTLAFTIQARRDLDIDGDSAVVLANLDKTGNTWSLNEDRRAVATCRDGVLETDGVDLRKVDDGYQLVCTGDRVHRYTVTF